MQANIINELDANASQKSTLLRHYFLNVVLSFSLFISFEGNALSVYWLTVKFEYGAFIKIIVL